MPARWRHRLISGILIVYLLIAATVGLRNTVLRLRAAVKTAGLPAHAVRELVFGRRYVAGVDLIRRSIPVAEPYLLSERDEPGAMLWARFDLLPRRAMYLGKVGSLPGDPRNCWVEQVRWMVVAAGVGRPPLLLERTTRIPPGCPPAPWARNGQ